MSEGYQFRMLLLGISFFFVVTALLVLYLLLMNGG
jgi:hypothetical protein